MNLAVRIVIVVIDWLFDLCEVIKGYKGNQAETNTKKLPIKIHESSKI